MWWRFLPSMCGRPREDEAFLKEGQLVVNVAKGIEESTLMTLTDILEEELPVLMWPFFPDRAMQKR